MQLSMVHGYDFARAMLLAGFRLLGVRSQCAVVEHRALALLIPQRDLTESELAELLAIARMTREHFDALLQRLGSRELRFERRTTPPPAPTESGVRPAFREHACADPDAARRRRRALV